MRTIGAHNGVGMGTRLAGSGYGVDTSFEDRLRTGQAPKRVSRRDKEEPHCENREDHREAEYKEKRKSKAAGGMSLWMLASRALPRGLYTTRRLCRGLFTYRWLEIHTSFRLPDLNIPLWYTWQQSAHFSLGRQRVRKHVDSLSE
jgi:hypothetical protein